MLRQSKPTQHAVAAMSRLAEVYKDSGVWLSSADITRSRNLRKPVVAKILSTLAQEGLVVGSPGPGGGYRLARNPDEISLWDIARLFEPDVNPGCPYGPGWCGNQSPCPVHGTIVALQQIIEDYLRHTRLDLFAKSPRPDPSSPIAAPAPTARRLPRER